MPTFYSTQAFRKALKKLCSKPKEGYTSVVKDICDTFSEKPIDEIRINNDMVLNENKFTIIKLRLPNSKLKLGKNDGFRLIYLVHKQEEEVTFFYVYPKRGSLQQITVKPKEIKSFLLEYIKEKEDSSLHIHDINNGLEDYTEKKAETE